MTRRTITSCVLLATFLLSLGAAYASEAGLGAEDRSKLALTTRRRVEAEKDGGRFKIVAEAVNWDPTETAIVIVDMWDDHHCVSASRRVTEMAPFMNRVVNEARKKGVLVIHAPSDCMDFYKDTPQRRRAQDAPFAKAPVEFKWNKHNPAREGPLPDEVADEGCSCDTSEPCGPDRKAWTRQIDTIDIAPGDAVSDDGQEIYNLLEHRGIKNVIVMGVHTNVCVLGRPFGIRQLVYLGKNVLLCRDLTDPYHRAPGRHFRGIDHIVEHIEKYWCPTITSTSLTGRPAFRFKADDRPRKS